MSLNEKQITAKILNNKTIHIELPGMIHKKFRANLFLKELSMQKFFCLMAESFINGDSHIHSLVEEKVSNLKDEKLSKLKNIDTKELYDAIEKNSPFKKQD